MKIFRLTLLYILVPAIIVFLTVKSEDWWMLFCIVLYYAGLIISKFKQWLFFPIPLVFAFWYWYTYGFSMSGYVFMFFICFFAGIALGELDKQLNKLIYSVIPEQINNLEYNEKVEELNRRLEKYRKDHPDQILTPEIVEKIRTDIFFQ